MLEFAKLYHKNAFLLQAFTEHLAHRNDLFRDFAYLGVNPFMAKLDFEGAASGYYEKYSPSASSSSYHLARQRSRPNDQSNTYSAQDNNLEEGKLAVQPPMSSLID
jgi:hypothetical protein